MYTISDVYFFFFEGNYIIDSAFPEASERREPGEPSPCSYSASRSPLSVFSYRIGDPPQYPWGDKGLQGVSHLRDQVQKALVWGFWKSSKFIIWVQLFCIFNTKYMVLLIKCNLTERPVGDGQPRCYIPPSSFLTVHTEHKKRSL